MDGENVDPEIKAMAEKRAMICINCPHFVQSNAYAVIDKIANIFTNTTKLEKSDVTGRTCNLCRCQFPAKILTKEERCPHDPPFWLPVE